jgi:hypothetical protein
MVRIHAELPLSSGERFDSANVAMGYILRVTACTPDILGIGVTVARMTLTHSVMVRIRDPQPLSDKRTPRGKPRKFATP